MSRMTIRVVGAVDDGSRGCDTPHNHNHFHAYFQFCLDSRCLELGGTVGMGGRALSSPPFSGVVGTPHQHTRQLLLVFI